MKKPFCIPLTPVMVLVPNMTGTSGQLLKLPSMDEYVPMILAEALEAAA